MGSLIAMSGGVDSSVAAYLTLQEEKHCIGATMRLYQNEDVGIPSGHTCCSLEDVEDARSVACRLGIPYYVFNFIDAFHRQVIDRFVCAYESGSTPNPCIDCNRYLKFDKLLCRARELSLERIVTGHYARITLDRGSGRFLLQKAADERKDQSYVLYAMTQDQLAHTAFPLGNMTKAQVRELAEAQGFRNARKHDSQDICFVPGGDYLEFLSRYTGRPHVPGNLLDETGRIIGRHRGAAGYTIGQRRGLGAACGKPVYVCRKSMEENTVTIGPEQRLYARTALVENVNWIAIRALDHPVRVMARTRYHQPEQPAVFYDGETVVGGGTIHTVLEDQSACGLE